MKGIKDYLIISRQLSRFDFMILLNESLDKIFKIIGKNEKYSYKTKTKEEKKLEGITKVALGNERFYKEIFCSKDLQKMKNILKTVSLKTEIIQGNYINEKTKTLCSSDDEKN